ncbi:hypothetical protein CCZ01_05670 [Helicobacter monodelphidis]|uniref:DUF2325 domain-containing protein n=1 Tax=Helicobacter sp. 15-1451 TaxID=2004995 RepID=UPI000DCEEA4F|nr:DUF2325 domain-containing protein [Helicobacter sp. 15-1451]RAX57627.1 hypothetical protein CCZ01_05670 [Helicobacter sp. 15-1451]
MSVLIIGGDEIIPIKAVLHSLGCEEVTHWDGRRESVNHKKIPQSTRCVILLTNFLNHNTMKKFRNEAKKRNIPTICSKRSVSCVYCEYCKIFGDGMVCDKECVAEEIA